MCCSALAACASIASHRGTWLCRALQVVREHAWQQPDAVRGAQHVSEASRCTRQTIAHPHTRALQCLCRPEGLTYKWHCHAVLTS